MGWKTGQCYLKTNKQKSKWQLQVLLGRITTTSRKFWRSYRFNIMVTSEISRLRNILTSTPKIHSEVLYQFDRKGDKKLTLFSDNFQINTNPNDSSQKAVWFKRFLTLSHRNLRPYFEIHKENVIQVLQIMIIASASI